MKDLIGIPWRVAFALQADGWYLRSDCIWHKPNPMPESVTDRPTKSHEYVFLLTKNARYYFDQDAVKEQTVYPEGSREDAPRGSFDGKNGDGAFRAIRNTRNIRTVWTIATQPTPFAHFATYPEKLVEPCIKAGTSERGCCPKCGKAWERVTEKDIDAPDGYGNMGEHSSKWFDQDAQSSGHRIQKNLNALRALGRDHDNPFPRKTTTGWQPSCSCDAGDPTPCIVLDPFAGSGTTGIVARRLGRHFVGLDLSRTYLHTIARRRLELDRLDAWKNGIQAGDDGWRDLPMFQGTQP